MTTADLLTLRARHGTASPLPAAVARVMPDPLDSYEAWQRFTHLDLAEMTPHQLWLELSQLDAAAAAVADLDRLPPWIVERAALLRRAARRRAA